MPTPATGFFGGLAKGIFGTMAEQEDRKRKEDLKNKEQTLSYLTGLMDQTTPETRPILMKQISDVMGLKGKQRGVWDMLTGGGRQDYSDALGEKLSEITGSVVGPKQFQEMQQQDLQADMGAAFQANSPYVRSSAPKQTAGKIALMDPRADRLAQIREQYGAMREAGLEKMELQNQFTNLRKEDEQAFRMQMAEKEQYNKAFGPVYKQAATIAASKGRTKLDPQDLEEAAQQIATLGGLNVDKLKAQIGLSQAKKLEAEANAKASGLGTDDPFAGVTPNQRLVHDEKQQASARGVKSEWDKAYAEVQKIDSEQKALRAEIARIDPDSGLSVSGTPAYSFDETQGTYVGKDGVTPVFVAPAAKAKIAKLKQLEAQKQALRATLKSKADTLRISFPDYYDVKDEWTVAPKAEFGGVAPAGAPRTGTGTYDATTRPGANIADMQEVIGSAARPSNNFKVGQVVSIGGKKYKVNSITPPTEDRPHGSYILQAVK